MKRKIRDIEECGVSINNAFDNFITSKKSEGRRDATIRSYKGSIKDFMKFCEDKGYTDVSEINKDLVEKYKLHLLDKDISAETRNTYLRTLKAFTSYLFEEDVLILRHIKRNNVFKIQQIPLNPNLKVALRKYLKRTRLVEQGVKYLFPNVEGNMLHPDSISKKMYKICEVSGVKPRACHHRCDTPP